MSDTGQILDLWIAFVKQQVAYHQRQVDRIDRRNATGKSELRRIRANHEHLIVQHNKLADFLKDSCSNATLAASGTLPSKVVSPTLHIQPEDLFGLPDELRSQLNISESDQLELDILEALRKAGGTLTVDKILIQLYLDTRTVHQRDKLASKLYRMSAKGRLKASTEHRGVYSLDSSYDLGVGSSEGQQSGNDEPEFDFEEENKPK